MKYSWATQVPARNCFSEIAHPRPDEEKERELRSTLNIPKGTVTRAPVREALEKLLKLSVRVSVRERLVKKGWLKSRKVFGSSLVAIAKAESAPVPAFLTRCCRLIAENPEFLKSEGLYRKNGNLASIQSFRFEVEEGREEKLDTIRNVHLLTGLVKLFFRELSSPLIPHDLILKLIKVNEGQQGKQVEAASKLLSTMEEPHRRTLQFMLSHLTVVAGEARENQMHCGNLAMMLGPSMSWPNDPAKINKNPVLLIKQNKVIQFLLENMEKLILT